MNLLRKCELFLLDNLLVLNYVNGYIMIEES